MTRGLSVRTVYVSITPLCLKRNGTIIIVLCALQVNLTARVTERHRFISIYVYVKVNFF